MGKVDLTSVAPQGDLQAENAALRRELASSERYQRIDATKEEHSLGVLCEALEVSSSVYCDWEQRKSSPSPQSMEQALLRCTGSKGVQKDVMIQNQSENKETRNACQLFPVSLFSSPNRNHGHTHVLSTTH